MRTLLLLAAGLALDLTADALLVVERAARRVGTKLTRRAQREESSLMKGAPNTTPRSGAPRREEARQVVRREPTPRHDTTFGPTLFPEMYRRVSKPGALEPLSDEAIERLVAEHRAKAAREAAVPSCRYCGVTAGVVPADFDGKSWDCKKCGSFVRTDGSSTFPTTIPSGGVADEDAIRRAFELAYSK